MLAFAADSLIGNLGAPLRVSEEGVENDEDNEHELQDLEEELVNTAARSSATVHEIGSNWPHFAGKSQRHRASAPMSFSRA